MEVDECLSLRYAVIVVLLLVGISLIVACTLANSLGSALGYLYVDEGISPELSTRELVAEVAPAVVSIVTETVGYNWFWRAVLNSSPFQMP
jgi:hypothetical protein